MTAAAGPRLPVQRRSEDPSPGPRRGRRLAPSSTIEHAAVMRSATPAARERTGAGARRGRHPRGPDEPRPRGRFTNHLARPKAAGPGTPRFQAWTGSPLTALKALEFRAFSRVGIVDSMFANCVRLPCDWVLECASAPNGLPPSSGQGGATNIRVASRSRRGAPWGRACNGELHARQTEPAPAANHFAQRYAVGAAARRPGR